MERVAHSIPSDMLKVKLDSMTPTTKKVLKLLKFPDNLDGLSVRTYLRSFVKSLDLRGLKKFLRFVTGADLLIDGNDISVSFVLMSNFERRPTSSACSCVLHLATNYTDYLDFKREFDAVLGDASIWVMDFH